jgi:hypothetical protein
MFFVTEAKQKPKSLLIRKMKNNRAENSRQNTEFSEVISSFSNGNRAE